jgi:hypothetical protein
MTTSSTAAGSIPERSTSALSTSPAMSAGVPAGELAAAAAAGRPEGFDDEGFGHGGPLPGPRSRAASLKLR